MAHVGTTTNLKQPAATGSERRTGVWMAVFAAAVVAAIALAFVMTQLVGSKTASGSLAGDRSYDQIEAQRGAVLSAAGDRGPTTRSKPSAAARISHQTSSTVAPTVAFRRRSSRGITTTTRFTRPCRRLSPASSSRVASIATSNRQLGSLGRGPEPKLRSSSAV